MISRLQRPCLGALLFSLASAPAVWAQSPAPVPPIGIGGTVRQGEEARQPPQPAPAAIPVLPQPVEPPLTLEERQTLRVREIRVDGPPLVAAAELRAVLAPYENRDLTLGKIYEAADKVTALYRGKGYLLAKAYVPAQDARGGVLRFDLLPGRYGKITINDASLVREDFLHHMIAQAPGGTTTIEKDELERAMLLISDLPGAGMPRVAVAAGQQPGTSDFVFDVPSGQRIDGYFLADNFGSPFTGRYRASLGINVNSPLGIGDRLSGFAIVSTDGDLVNGRIAYAFPLGYSGARGEIAVFRTSYALGAGFSALDATGIADGVSATVSYPLKRQREDSIVISAGYAYKALNDMVFGTSIANRTIDVGNAGIERDTAGALAGMVFVTNASLNFEVGDVNFADPAQKAANIAGIDTAGSFAKINVSLSATLALSDKWSLSGSVLGQKSLTSSLDSSEQMPLTGYWGVRSFDEGVTGDSGIAFRPELKYALPDIQNYHHAVGLFADVAAAWLYRSALTTGQKAYTELNDAGLGYYGSYEYSPGRSLLLKAMVAQTIGTDDGVRSYDRGTKGLIQVGFTF